ncbi:Hypothetical predicted protein [Octopus vulgaris]|uniref:Uncharacterized protein n=1 Tax=Octopus vulgaris TaxID=6645 RepID=A0AA36FDD7_OCTVU|nr:Hypothetical predicted protein [Octopus vulgaris]
MASNVPCQQTFSQLQLQSLCSLMLFTVHQYIKLLLKTGDIEIIRFNPIPECLCVCVCVHVYTHAYMHTHIDTHTNMCTNTYTSTHTQTFIHTSHLHVFIFTDYKQWFR